MPPPALFHRSLVPTRMTVTVHSILSATQRLVKTIHVCLYSLGGDT